jgi:hypothetical protein
MVGDRIHSVHMDAMLTHSKINALETALRVIYQINFK